METEVVSIAENKAEKDAAPFRVEVKPIDRTKWHGKKGSESFARPITVEALYDNNTGKYATGLSEEEAEIYGKRLGVSLSDVFNPNEPHPFYSSKAAWVTLENHTMIFDTRKALDFVKVKLMKASKLVANSEKELAEGKWPEATHVIIDEVEEVAMKAVKSQSKAKAYVLASKMSAASKINMIQVISNKNLKGRGNDFIDVELEDIIENKADEFLKYGNMGPEEVTLRAQVLEAIQKNVLTKEGGSIFYMGEQIAFDYEAAVEWFRQPNNQKLKVAILEKLNK